MSFESYPMPYDGDRNAIGHGTLCAQAAALAAPEAELVLIRVNAEPQHRAEVLRTADIFRAKVIDVTAASFTLEATGDEGKLEALIEPLVANAATGGLYMLQATDPHGNVWLPGTTCKEQRRYGATNYDSHRLPCIRKSRATRAESLRCTRMSRLLSNMTERCSHVTANSGAEIKTRG